MSPIPIHTDVESYRAALLQEAECEKRLIDAKTERLIHEKILSFRQAAAEKIESSGASDFITKNADRLEPADIELLKGEYCTTGEASQYTGLSPTTIKRYANSGSLRTKRSAGGRRLISTESLVEYMLNGQTDETP